MPTYDYQCAANGRTVQVQHRMSESVSTWGEVCALGKIEPGDTPRDTPVAKVILAATTMHRKNLGSDSSGGSAFGAQTVTRAYHSTKNF